MRIILVTFALSILSVSTCVAIERVSVREMTARKNEWDTWIRKGTVLQISGRYEGRFAKEFRLFRLPAAITAARTTILPRNLQAKHRITITGTLTRSGNRLEIEAKRIAIGTDDITRLTVAVTKLENDTANKTYALTAHYSKIAQFYEDERLAKEVTTIVHETFLKERVSLKGNPSGLTQLADRGKALEIPQRILQSIRFESLISEFQSKNVNLKSLASKLKLQLAEWDRTKPFENKIAESRFLANPIAEYDEASPQLRLQMHRRFYRQVRLSILLTTLHQDGSNAKETASAIKRELPEETKSIARLKMQHVDYRLSQISRLTRRQLQELETLLEKSERTKEFPEALTQWINAQEKRLNNGQLDGILATSEEYLFAFEHWKRTEHRDFGIKLLKQAWAISEKEAPREARRIAKRLERLGWTRLHSDWLTTEQVTNLPKSDIELAMREGRVVVGMHPEQIRGTLGEPSRRIRIISSLHIQEIWLYGDAGSTTIKIHLKRSRSRPAAEAFVTLIAKGNG